MSNVRYLVFDIESVADPELVARLRYPGQKLTPLEAVTRYRSELMEKYDSDFIPYTFQVPVSVAIRLLYSEMGRLDSAHNTLVLLPLARKKRARHRNDPAPGSWDTCVETSGSADTSCWPRS